MSEKWTVAEPTPFGVIVEADRQTICFVEIEVRRTEAEAVALAARIAELPDLRRQRDELLAVLVKLHTFLDFDSPLEAWEWGIENPAELNAAMGEARALIRNATK